VSVRRGIRFRFESTEEGGWVDVLANSALVSGSVVTQNAGSTFPGIYYKVGGGGLNQVFFDELGGAEGVKNVNAELEKAYDAKFGEGSWDRDSENPPSPAPLTSLLVPLKAASGVGDNVVGMVYSVGPVLSEAGLTGSLQSNYTQIYRDAMTAIAASTTRPHAFRITMLSTNIYSGGAPIGPLADAAARCIIEAIRGAVIEDPVALAGLTILINTNRNAKPPKELDGFTHAATSLGLEVSGDGFSLPAT
jgi:hypothetical protein